MAPGLDLEGGAPVERSTLDRDSLRLRLEAWLAARLPGADEVSVPGLGAPSGTGMSSETLLFEAVVRESGTERREPLVARLAPHPRDVPVFPRYDLAAQFRLIERVGRAGVPAPAVRWLETDPGALGAPFFVMERVEGRVPPDIPPYPFAGWILEASAAERDRLQEATLEAICALHAIDLAGEDLAYLAFATAGDTPLCRHVQNQRDYYAWVVADGVRHPLIERAFVWIDAHWPAHEGPAVISWGDSRIGNVLYRGFEPAALLDWEMAGPGPRELDLGWLCFMHRFFQDFAEAAGQPGLPDFLRLPDVAARYEKRSGHPPRDLLWYYTYAALRHGIIMSRIHRRMQHFGQAERPADPDDCIPHRAQLEGLIAGHWSPLD